MELTAKDENINNDDMFRVLNESLLCLSEQLKQLCTTSGEERKDQLELTANIFHKMAMHFKQIKPDKTALIKCVGLLNAAISRDPSNVDSIKNDLKKVCDKILKLAEAKRKKVDLIKRSRIIGEKINEMRDHTKLKLEKLLKSCTSETSSDKLPEHNENNKKVPGNELAFHAVDDSELHKYEKSKIRDIHSLQIYIANTYSEIMSRLSGICEEIKGDPPCKYAVVGMGSLARSEITPYSDFEHIIVLENGCETKINYPEILEYFRWFSVIFHVIVLNLQETIVPSLDIDCLDWFYDKFSKRGISFDGMMPYACKFPLGRQQPTKEKPWATELIKPIDKMMEYLSTESSLKNGYHLGDILTKTIFVSGDIDLYNDFKKKVNNLVETRKSEENMEDIEKQVKEDLTKFSIKVVASDIRCKEKINIKHFYRSTTLFVAALGRMHKIMVESSFEIIEELSEKNIISEITKHHLQYAVALACELRLRCYTKEDRQDDQIQALTEGERASTHFKSILGTENTVKYLQIVYCLQRIVAKNFRRIKKHFYANPLFLNIFLCFGFEFEKEMMVLLRSVKAQNVYEDCIEFDKLNDLFLSNIKKVSEKSSRHEPKNETDKAEAFDRIGDDLKEKGFKHDALYFYKCSYSLLAELKRKKLTAKPEDLKLLKKADEIMAESLLSQIDYSLDQEENLKKSREALEIYHRISTDVEKDSNVALALNHIGTSYSKLNELEKAVFFHDKSNQINKTKKSRKRNITET